MDGAPSQTFGYGPSTGLPTTTDSRQHRQVVTTAYDSLGRVHTYTDATGADHDHQLRHRWPAHDSGGPERTTTTIPMTARRVSTAGL